MIISNWLVANVNYDPSIAGFDSYLFSFNSLDLNSSYDSLVSIVNFQNSNIGFLNFNGILNTLPSNLSHK